MRTLPILALAAMVALVDGTALANPAPLDSYEVTVRAGRGRLGFVAIEISPELRAHFGAPTDAGVLVDRVRPDSPAAKAGLRPGDVLIQADAARTTSATEVLDALSDRKKGDKVPLVVMRAGKRTTLDAMLEDDPAPAMSNMKWHRFEDFAPFGDDTMRKSFEEMRERLEELERRFDQKNPKIPPSTKRT